MTGSNKDGYFSEVMDVLDRLEKKAQDGDLAAYLDITAIEHRGIYAARGSEMAYLNGIQHLKFPEQRYQYFHWYVEINFSKYHATERELTTKEWETLQETDPEETMERARRIDILTYVRKLMENAAREAVDKYLQKPDSLELVPGGSLENTPFKLFDAMTKDVFLSIETRKKAAIAFVRASKDELGQHISRMLKELQLGNPGFSPDVRSVLIRESERVRGTTAAVDADMRDKYKSAIKRKPSTIPKRSRRDRRV